MYDHAKIKELVRHGFVTNPHVYSVVNNAMTSSLQVPWYVYQEKNSVQAKRFKAMKQGLNFEAVFDIEHKAVDIFTGKNAVTKLLERPNAKQTWEELFTTCMGMYMLTGNVYLYFVTHKAFPDRVLEIIPLPSQMMKVLVEGWEANVTGYEMLLGNDEGVKFKPSEILHIKRFSPELTYQDGVFTMPVYGLSPLSPLCKNIQQSNDGYTAAMKILQNGYLIGLLTNASNEPMTDAEMKDAQEKLSKGYGGPGNAGKIKLTTANLKYIQIGMNSVEMGLTTIQDSTLGTVCAAYGYPAPNITGKNANFNTSKEAEKQKWNDALLPIFNVIRDHVNMALQDRKVLPEGMFIDYDHRAIPSLQQDLEKLNKIVITQLEHALIRKPEANRKLGNEDIASPHDDKYFILNTMRFTTDPPPGQTGLDSNTQTDAGKTEADDEEQTAA